jgi:hypothetical protein
VLPSWVGGDSRSFNVLQSELLTLDSVNRDQTQISGHFEFKVAPQSDPDTVVTITGAFSELPIEQVRDGAVANTAVPGSDPGRTQLEHRILSAKTLEFTHTISFPQSDKLKRLSTESAFR